MSFSPRIRDISQALAHSLMSQVTKKHTNREAEATNGVNTRFTATFVWFTYADRVNRLPGWGVSVRGAGDIRTNSKVHTEAEEIRGFSEAAVRAAIARAVQKINTHFAAR